MARFLVLWYNIDTMPLKKGKQNIGKNIHELIKNSGKIGQNRVNGKVRPVKQAIAIALSVAKKK